MLVYATNISRKLRMCKWRREEASWGAVTALDRHRNGGFLSKNMFHPHRNVAVRMGSKIAQAEKYPIQHDIRSH
jgi:hypothetical protein